MLRIFEFFFKGKKKKNKTVTPRRLTNEPVQISVHMLEQGMYVSKLDIPWLDSPFLFQGFLIETDKQLVKLTEVCQFVYLDLSKQKTINIIKKTNIDSIKKTKQSELITSSVPKRLGSFNKEFTQAKLNYQDTGRLVADFMDKVSCGGSIDGKLAKEAVSACVNSILHSPDALLWLTQLKNQDQYTAQHSLNVCILAIVLGRQIGLSEQELNNVGLCGMLHDVGKMLVPSDILNKPGKLDPDEMLQMQQHTILGYELLKSSENLFPGAIEVALTHHERMDGKGYPRKLAPKHLSFYSNIVAIVDTYDAITSDRVYQKGRTHHEAVKIMLDVSGSHLDSVLVVKFIQSLGAYPPGSFVELSNEKIAVVVEENYQQKLWPKILIILDSEKQVTKEQLIDLSKFIHDSSGAVISIKRIIKPAEYNIDSKKYYKEGVMQKGFKR